MSAHSDLWGETAIRNLVILCFGALPVGVLAFAANEALLVEDGVWMSWNDLLLIYLTLVLPLSVGGYVHQQLTAWIARRHGSGTGRVLSSVSSPVVLLGLVVMIDDRLLVRSALPLVITLATYLVLMRYPEHQDDISKEDVGG